MALWTIRSSSLRQRLIRRLCSISRRMRQRPSRSISCCAAATFLSSMMTFPSTRLLTARFLCCSAEARDVKRIPVMFSTCIRDFSSVPRDCPMRSAAAPLRRSRSSRRRMAMYPHTFRPTSFPLRTVRFSWSRICFSKDSAPRSTSDFRYPVSAAPHRPKP